MSLIRQTTDQPEVVEVPPQECECEKARAVTPGAWPTCGFHPGAVVPAVGQFRVPPPYQPNGVMWLCDDCASRSRERIQ